MPRERTHWEGCWRERTHHECALVRIAALEAELAAEREIVDRIWDIFGRPDYKSLNGRSIYDLVAAELKRRESAEAALNASAARIITLDTALRDYADALVAERKRREDAEALLHNYSRLADAAMFDANRSGYEYDRKGEMVDISAHFARYKD